jgi:hypothetical protein
MRCASIDAETRPKPLFRKKEVITFQLFSKWDHPGLLMHTIFYYLIISIKVYSLRNIGLINVSAT